MYVKVIWYKALFIDKSTQNFSILKSLLNLPYTFKAYGDRPRLKQPNYFLFHFALSFLSL